MTGLQGLVAKARKLPKQSGELKGEQTHPVVLRQHFVLSFNEVTILGGRQR